MLFMQTRGKQAQLNRLGWFLPLRLITFVILFAVVVFGIDYPGFLHLPLILYSVFTLGFALLLAFDRRHRLQMMSVSVIALQFLLEIVDYYDPQKDAERKYRFPHKDGEMHEHASTAREGAFPNR